MSILELPITETHQRHSKSLSTLTSALVISIRWPLDIAIITFTQTDNIMLLHIHYMTVEFYTLHLLFCVADGISGNDTFPDLGGVAGCIHRIHFYFLLDLNLLKEVIGHRYVHHCSLSKSSILFSSLLWYRWLDVWDGLVTRETDTSGF